MSISPHFKFNRLWTLGGGEVGRGWTMTMWTQWVFFTWLASSLWLCRTVSSQAVGLANQNRGSILHHPPTTTMGTPSMTAPHYFSIHSFNQNQGHSHGHGQGQGQGHIIPPLGAIGGRATATMATMSTGSQGHHWQYGPSGGMHPYPHSKETSSLATVSGGTVGGGGGAWNDSAGTMATFGHAHGGSGGTMVTNFMTTIPPTVVHGPHSSYSLFQMIIIAWVGGCLGLLTVLGNILVMVSFKIDKQLQTISNYFLFSLAVADFIIGLVSMPLFTVYLLMGYWPFGPMICDAWLALDYLASNASVLNLLIISFDRYFSVTRPLTYRARRTTRRAAVMISSAWGISLVLWPPWIYAWPYIEGKKTVPDEECYIQFIETNHYITFGTAIAAFYVPVSIMLVLYWRIWLETEKRQRDLSQLQAGKKDSSRRSNSSDEAVDVEEWKRIRSESCICQDHLDQISGCPAHRRQSRLPRWCHSRWECLCRLYESFSRFCRVDRDPDDLEDVEDEHASPGCGTPASIETPLQSSVSRCTSLNVIRDPLAQTPTRRTDSVNSATLTTAAQSTATQTIGQQTIAANPNGTNGKGPSSDSVYTILIRIPCETEAGKNASIRMIQEPGPLPPLPPMLHPKAKLAISNPDYSTTGHRPGSPAPLTVTTSVGSATTASSAAGVVGGTPAAGTGTGTGTGAVAVGAATVGTNTTATATTTTLIGRRTSTAAVAALNSKLLSKSGAKGSTTTLSGTSTTTVIPSVQPKRKKKKSQEKKQEKKAAKTLSAILLAFIVTWTPYNILVLLRTVLSESEPDPIPPVIWDMAYYLCYINSTINPMCYALCNASFRRTYVRILTCKWDNNRRQAVNRGYYN